MGIYNRVNKIGDIFQKEKIFFMLQYSIETKLETNLERDIENFKKEMNVILLSEFGFSKDYFQNCFYDIIHFLKVEYTNIDNFTKTSVTCKYFKQNNNQRNKLIICHSIFYYYGNVCNLKQFNFPLILLKSGQK